MKQNWCKIGLIQRHSFKIYKVRDYTIFWKIEIKKQIITNAIILDNNDLILLMETSEMDFDIYYSLQIYKLEKDNYILNQIIENDDKGYREKETRGGCLIRRLIFSVKNIIKLSNNRFITISNHGFKVYSL